MASILDEIINTNDYPVNQPNSADYRQLIERLNNEFKTNGIVLLPQFMKKDAIEKTLQTIEQSSHVPFRKEVSHNIYLEDIEDEGIEDEDHPKKIHLRSCLHAYTYDQIDPLTPLNQLFMSDEMTEFVRCVLGTDKLYRRVDSLGAVNVLKFLDGDTLNWHFDRSRFAVTCLLQEPRLGGEFEYYPSLRDEENPNYNKIKEIMTLSKDGQTNLEEHGVKLGSLKAGTLSIFCGLHSLHRVKPVQGDIPRYIAILSYNENPGVNLNDYVKRKFFGRLK